MSEIEPAEQQKQRALQAILEAWEAALREGVAPELLASAAIYAALTDMVDIHGAEPVAAMVEGLHERIRRGEFTLKVDPA